MSETNEEPVNFYNLDIYFRILFLRTEKYKIYVYVPFYWIKKITSHLVDVN